MKIHFDNVDYRFVNKPLLVGGGAMEYYQLRKAGKDIDFIVSLEDFAGLADRYPYHIETRFDNREVYLDHLQFWESLVHFGYDFLSSRALEKENYRVISLELLLLLVALAMARPRNERDVRLIVKKIHDIQYARDNTLDGSYFQGEKASLHCGPLVVKRGSTRLDDGGEPGRR